MLGVKRHALKPIDSMFSTSIVSAWFDLILVQRKLSSPIKNASLEKEIVDNYNISVFGEETHSLL